MKIGTVVKFSKEIIRKFSMSGNVSSDVQKVYVSEDTRKIFRENMMEHRVLAPSDDETKSDSKDPYIKQCLHNIFYTEDNEVDKRIAAKYRALKDTPEYREQQEIDRKKQAIHRCYIDNHVYKTDDSDREDLFNKIFKF